MIGQGLAALRRDSSETAGKGRCAPAIKFGAPAGNGARPVGTGALAGQRVGAGPGETLPPNVRADAPIGQGRDAVTEEGLTTAAGPGNEVDSPTESS